MRCVVTDANGKSMASDAAKMFVKTASKELNITSQPVDCEGQLGDLVSFKVTAEGQGLSYQWQLSDDGGQNWRNSANQTKELCRNN